MSPFGILCASLHKWDGPKNDAHSRVMSTPYYMCTECGVEVTEKELVEYDGLFLGTRFMLEDIVARRSLD
jgi:hypothetical protein